MVSYCGTYHVVLYQALRVTDGICDCCDGSDESIACDNTCAALENLRAEAEEAERNRKEAGLLAQTKLKDEAAELYAAKIAEGAEAKKRAGELQREVDDMRGEVAAATKVEYEENQLSVIDIEAMAVEYKARYAADIPRETLLKSILHGALQGGQSLLESLILSTERFLKESGAAVETEMAVEDLHSFTTLRESCSAGDDTGNKIISEDFNKIADSLQKHISLTSLGAAELGEIAFDLYESLHMDCETSGLFSRSEDVKTALESACEIRRRFQNKKAERMKPVEDLQLILSQKRDVLSTLEGDLKVVKLKSSEYDDIIKKDFGPDNLLFLFYKKCYEMSRDKYYYSICPFGTAKQDGTTLGKFDSLERLDNQVIIKFKYGDHCFATKRPRDLSLSMQCGREAKLIDITEPETCSYAAILETPVAC